MGEGFISEEEKKRYWEFRKLLRQIREDYKKKLRALYLLYPEFVSEDDL